MLTWIAILIRQAIKRNWVFRNWLICKARMGLYLILSQSIRIKSLVLKIRSEALKTMLSPGRASFMMRMAIKLKICCKKIVEVTG